MRSKFTVTGYNTVEHRGTCPLTGEDFIRRYWTPIRTDGYAGYVRVDDSKDGSMGGTLGKQPYTNGATWMCKPEQLLGMVKRDWRVEKRMATKWMEV